MYSQTTAVATGPDRQRLARKLVRDLVTFAGITTREFAPRPPRRQVGHRTFYRKNPSDADLENGIVEVGLDRWLAAADRVTKPRCDATPDLFVAANGGAS
jgi:hypothetical protein